MLEASQSPAPAAAVRRVHASLLGQPRYRGEHERRSQTMGLPPSFSLFADFTGAVAGISWLNDIAYLLL